MLLSFSQELIITGITFRDGAHDPVFGEGAVFGLVVDGDTRADQNLTFNYSQSRHLNSVITTLLTPTHSDFWIGALTVTLTVVPLSP